MAEPSTHINYTFEDIQRYLQGKMSAAEMHALEKAALQDPFLSDAIEGYREASSSTAQQHLNEINAALHEKKQDSKVLSIKKSNQWLRIAAVIILLAGIGVIGTYFFKKSNNQNQIAQVKNKEFQKQSITKDSVETVKAETLSVKKPVPVIAQNKKKRNVHSAKKERAKELYVNDDTDNEKNSVTSINVSPEQTTEADKVFATMSSHQNNDSISNLFKNKTNGGNFATNTFAGKVIDENSKPIAGALIQSTDKKNAALTDLNGNFSLQNNDTALSVMASTVGYTTKTTSLHQGSNIPIVLQGANSSLNDVVVTAVGASKKYKASHDSATPVGGWQNFNNYVMSKLNKDSTDNNNMSQADIVELEFLIDDSGNPYNIHVTKSLGDERNSKAIDILKSGPRWTSSLKKKKAKVAITF